MSNYLYNTSVAQDESQEITNTTSQEGYKLIIKQDLRSKKKYGTLITIYPNCFLG